MAMHGPKTEAEDMEMSTDDSAEVKAPTLKDHYLALPEEYQQTEEELLANYEAPQWSPNAYFAASRGIEATTEEQEAHKAQFLNAQMQQAITRFQKQDPFYLAEQAHLARQHGPKPTAPTASQRASLHATVAQDQLKTLNSFLLDRRERQEYLDPKHSSAPEFNSESSSAKDLFKQTGSYAPQSARMMLFNDALSTQLTAGHKLDSASAKRGETLMASVREKQTTRAKIERQELPYAAVAKMNISDDASTPSTSASGWKTVGRRGKPRK